MTIISTHTKSLDEILDEANESSNPTQTLKKYIEQPYVKKYLEHAVSDKWTTLDVDTVKHKEYDYCRALAGAILLNSKTMSIVDKIFMEETVVLRAKKFQYKALMEMLYIGEAQVLKAILTKNITSLYPNLTFEIINDALNETL